MYKILKVWAILNIFIEFVKILLLLFMFWFFPKIKSVTVSTVSIYLP